MRLRGFRSAVVLTAVSALMTAGVCTALSAAAAVGAVVDLSGCRDSTLPRNDDGSTGVVDLPFLLDFYGQGYRQAFVNNNGNITFDQPLTTYTPFGLIATYLPIIAPFFADVDTRGGEGVTTYGTTTYDGHQAFCVSWPRVGYYPNQVDKLNTFQLLLVQRADWGNGDFDIVFNYDSILWETGGASGGSGGLGGASAYAGFSSGSGSEDTSYELPGSGVNGALLDSNATTGLANSSRGTAVPGRFVFSIRNGSPNFIERRPEELFGERPGSFYASDPVNTATGNLTDAALDLDAPSGLFGMSLERTYNSRDAVARDLGRGWSSPLGVQVVTGDAGSAELIDADGRTVPFSPDGQGGWQRPADFTGDLSKTPDDTYQLRFDDGSRWVFDAAGALHEMRDWTGQVVSVERGGAGRVTTLHSSTGAAVAFTRDDAGRVTSAATDDGRSVHYSYTGEDLTAVIDAAGGTTGYTYDADGRLLTKTGPDGRVDMMNTFDRSGRVLTQTTAAGDVVTFGYDDLDGVTTISDEATGAVTQASHDTAGRPTKVTDSKGGTVTRNFDSRGNLVGVIDRS